RRTTQALWESKKSGFCTYPPALPKLVDRPCGMQLQGARQTRTPSLLAAFVVQRSPDTGSFHAFGFSALVELVSVPQGVVIQHRRMKITDLGLSAGQYVGRG